jgi:uncharacterized metal-binding protein
LFCVFFDILATFAPLRAKYEHSRKKKVIFSCSGTSGDSNAQLGADIPRSVEIHFRRVLSTFRPPKSSFSMETEIFRRYKIIKNSKKTDFPVFYVIANSQEIILSLGRFLCFLRFLSFFSDILATFAPLRAKYEHSRKKIMIFSCSGTPGDSNALLGADVASLSAKTFHVKWKCLFDEF